MNVIQKMLGDYYEIIEYDNETRPVVLENIDKVINCLFEAVSDVIKKLFFSLNKSKNFVPGFICVLHTFGRPVIALSRIDSYDGVMVTFHFNKHEDNSFVQRTIPAIDFIKLLIQHIPEKRFGFLWMN